MQKATNFIQILCRTLLLAAVLQSCGQGPEYARLTGYAQGGVYSVIYNCDGVTVPQDELQAGVDSILAVIDSSLSGYNKSSILSRYNSGENPRTDAVFDEVMGLAHKYKAETGGALDCAAGPLFDIWGFGFSGGTMPDSAEVASTLCGCGMGRLKPLMSFDGIIRDDGMLYPQDLLLDGVSGPLPRLNFNAFAQGFSADMVADYLHSLGVRDMLVDIGEIYCEGHNPSGEPWTIGVDRPVDGNDTPGADLQAIHRCTAAPQGIVTSGNYRKFYVRDGRKYSHTIDPRTGFPVQHNLLSATVVSDRSVTADAAATCCMVLGFEQARAFLDRFGYEGYLLYEEDGRIVGWHSDGFDVTSR